MIRHSEITEAAHARCFCHRLQSVAAVRSVSVCVQDPTDISVSDEFWQFASLSEFDLTTTFPQLRLYKGKTKCRIDGFLGSTGDHFIARKQSFFVERHPTL